MDRRHPFSADNSAQAAAALLASKRLNEAADKARDGAGDVLQSGSTLQQWKSVEEAREKVRADSRRMECPHCGWPSTVRTSSKVTRLLHQAIFHCTNDECNHRFLTQTEVVCTLGLSMTPDPSLNLKISDHIKSDVLVAQLQNSEVVKYESRNRAKHENLSGDLFAAGLHDPPD